MPKKDLLMEVEWQGVQSVVDHLRVVSLEEE